MLKQENNNAYGKTSDLILKFCCRRKVTVLDDVYFTAPFKIMKPFTSATSARFMILSASAGIMAGDQQKINICLEKGADVELTSQSYEKIHKMPDDAEGTRNIEITMANDTRLFYMPQPTIPFAQSAFVDSTVIHLTNNTAKLFFSEILSSGRTAHHERFLYRKYISSIKIYENENLCYFENTRYLPMQQTLVSFGFYEGYTHLATLLIFNFANSKKLLEKIRQLITDATEIDGGASLINDDKLCIKAFANSSEVLVNFTNTIKRLLNT